MTIGHLAPPILRGYVVECNYLNHIEEEAHAKTHCNQE